MGYKQKGFSKHATKSAYKTVDDRETQNRIGDMLTEMEAGGATQKEMFDAIKADPGHDGTTSYAIVDGKVKTMPREESRTGRFRYDEVGDGTTAQTADMKTLYDIDSKAPVKHFSGKEHKKPNPDDPSTWGDEKNYQNALLNYKDDKFRSQVKSPTFNQDEMDKDISDTERKEGGKHEHGSKYESGDVIGGKYKSRLQENIKKGHKRDAYFDDKNNTWETYPEGYLREGKYRY